MFSLGKYIILLAVSLFCVYVNNCLLDMFMNNFKYEYIVYKTIINILTHMQDQIEHICNLMTVNIDSSFDISV
jgi:hypothetical protein